MFYLITGILIFIGVFYFIITEKVSAPWATMSGGMLMVLMGILTEEHVFEAIHGGLEIIFLLIGMMIIVHLISETGIFQWFAIKAAQLVKGKPFSLMVLLAIVTGIASAFLDNVTTMLLIIPVTTVLAGELKLNPYPFIMTEIMAANIGGMATLIGDPPQLIIGNEAELGFNDFLMNTAPLAILAMLLLIVNVYFIYGKKLRVSSDLRARIMELNPNRTLKNPKLLKKAGTIFILVIIGFLLNNFIHKGLAVIAISGALLLVILEGIKPEEIFNHVEWDTLFFFMGLFIMVKGVEKVNLISMIGNEVVRFTEGNGMLAATTVTGVSALLTSLIGNVATAATASKVVHILTPTFENLKDPHIFWWALSVGSCLGGNLTLLASASNIIAVAASEKAGCKISFFQFMKLGTFISLQTLILGILYIKLRYL